MKKNSNQLYCSALAGKKEQRQGKADHHAPFPNATAVGSPNEITRVHVERLQGLLLLFFGVVMRRRVMRRVRMPSRVTHLGIFPSFSARQQNKHTKGNAIFTRKHDCNRDLLYLLAASVCSQPGGAVDDLLWKPGSA
jgi:hypothetical protein